MSAPAKDATSVGAYRLIKKLGEGGMGEVWEAEHQVIGRRAAIKFLLPAFSQTPGTVERFFNEARAVGSLADPGIIQIYDYGSADKGAYIVMELLEGEELSARMRRLGRLPPLDVVRLARQIASSLASVHGKGVIHRDLKPDNVFVVGDPAVTGGERTKILDFGIAKLTQHDSQWKTQTGAMVGTPTYMSPEQCRATPIDHRSDIYSLGVMMFVMVTGQPPFRGEGSGDVVIAHVRDQPPKPSTIYRDTPRALETIILRCLEKQPDARYQSADELLAALAAAERTLTSGYEPTAEIVVTYDSAPITVARPPRRRGLLIAAGAFALLGVTAAVLVIARGPRATPAPTPAPAPVPMRVIEPTPAAPLDREPDREPPAPPPVVVEPAPAKPTPKKPARVVKPPVATPPATPSFDRGD